MYELRGTKSIRTRQPIAPICLRSLDQMIAPISLRSNTLDNDRTSLWTINCLSYYTLLIRSSPSRPTDNQDNDSAVTPAITNGRWHRTATRTDLWLLLPATVPIPGCLTAANHYRPLLLRPQHHTRLLLLCLQHYLMMAPHCHQNRQSLHCLQHYKDNSYIACSKNPLRSRRRQRVCYTRRQGDDNGCTTNSRKILATLGVG